MNTGDVIAIDLGRNKQCYFVEGLESGNIGGGTNVENVIVGGCASAECTGYCPTPTPTITPTKTVTPTITPSNTLNSVFVESCCNLGQYYEITYLNESADKVPTSKNEVWVISGQTSMSNTCYTIVNPVEGDYIVVSFDGTFLGNGLVPYQEEGVPYNTEGNC